MRLFILLLYFVHVPVNLPVVGCGEITPALEELWHCDKFETPCLHSGNELLKSLCGSIVPLEIVEQDNVPILHRIQQSLKPLLRAHFLFPVLASPSRYKHLLYALVHKGIVVDVWRAEEHRTHPGELLYLVRCLFYLGNDFFFAKFGHMPVGSRMVLKITAQCHCP